MAHIRSPAAQPQLPLPAGFGACRSFGRRCALVPAALRRRRRARRRRVRRGPWRWGWRSALRRPRRSPPQRWPSRSPSVRARGRGGPGAAAARRPRCRSARVLVAAALHDEEHADDRDERHDRADDDEDRRLLGLRRGDRPRAGRDGIARRRDRGRAEREQAEARRDPGPGSSMCGSRAGLGEGLEVDEARVLTRRGRARRRRREPPRPWR